MRDLKKVKKSYDYQNDVLFVRSKESSYHKSISIHRDIILDLNKKGDILGFEIHHASDAFNIPKAHLQNIEGVRGEITVSEEYLEFKINIITKVRNKTQQRGTYNLNNQRPKSLQAQKQNLATT